MGYEHEGLSALPPFSRPSTGLLEALVLDSRARIFPAGQVIWWEGDRGHEILVLESGRLRNARIGSDGHETTLAVIEPVSILGAMELFGGGGHESTLIALRTSIVRLVPRRAVHMVMRHEPALANELLDCLVNELRRANERHVRIVNCDVRQRLLLWLAERVVNDFDPLSHAAARVTIDRTQGELADELWTTRSTLNRVIHDLEESGVIRVDGNVIVLLKSQCHEADPPIERQPTRLPIPPDRDSSRVVEP